jgi:hypothetical protein
MKLKNWASIALMIIAGGCILSIFFTDNKITNAGALIIAALCAAIYGKYSKLVDRR